MIQMRNDLLQQIVVNQKDTDTVHNEGQQDVSHNAFECILKKIEDNNSKENTVIGDIIPNNILKEITGTLQLCMRQTLAQALQDGDESENGFFQPDPYASALSSLPALTSTIQRSSHSAPMQSENPYAKNIKDAAERFNVDGKLIHAVIKAESDYNPLATSRTGAKGLMQLMPATAQELGVHNPYNPEENIMGGTRYLRSLLDRYGGNLTVALAAYNWGMGNVEKNPEQLPAETRNYIAKVIKHFSV